MVAPWTCKDTRYILSDFNIEFCYLNSYCLTLFTSFPLNFFYKLQNFKPHNLSIVNLTS